MMNRYSDIEKTIANNFKIYKKIHTIEQLSSTERSSQLGSENNIENNSQNYQKFRNSLSKESDSIKIHRKEKILPPSLIQKLKKKTSYQISKNIGNHENDIPYTSIIIEESDNSYAYLGKTTKSIPYNQSTNFLHEIPVYEKEIMNSKANEEKIVMAYKAKRGSASQYNRIAARYMYPHIRSNPQQLRKESIDSEISRDFSNTISEINLNSGNVKTLPPNNFEDSQILTPRHKTIKLNGSKLDLSKAEEFQKSNRSAKSLFYKSKDSTNTDSNISKTKQSYQSIESSMHKYEPITHDLISKKKIKSIKKRFRSISPLTLRKIDINPYLLNNKKKSPPDIEGTDLRKLPYNIPIRRSIQRLETEKSLKKKDPAIIFNKKKKSHLRKILPPIKLENISSSAALKVYQSTENMIMITKNLPKKLTANP